MSPRRPTLNRAVSLAHVLAGERLSPGDTAVDATAGNGHDTAFLAARTTPGGRVVAIDVQEEALASASSRTAGWDHVEYHHACHGTIAAILGESRARVVMFNLGYLPRGNKGITTRPATTRTALDGSLTILEPGGLITVVVYPGHDGGHEERACVEDWARSLDQDRFSAIHYRFLNQRNDPPELVAVEKREEN